MYVFYSLPKKRFDFDFDENVGSTHDKVGLSVISFFLKEKKMFLNKLCKWRGVCRALDLCIILVEVEVLFSVTDG